MFKVSSRAALYRVRDGVFASDESYGCNGQFVIKKMLIQISDGMGWEHVSVSRKSRCPSWDEMCYVRDLFWDPGDVVVQLHPPKKDYINNHPYCLHLWRKAGTNDFCELPPTELVGLK